MAKRKKKKHRPRPSKSRASAVRRFRKPGDEAEPVLPGLLAWCTRYGLYIVIALAVAYAASFCAISHFKYRNFNYNDFDLAIFSNAMWNTAHGDFMYTAIRSGCYFKDHVPVILLALVPIYRLFPSPLTLLYAQSIMLGAGAVPLFLLARRELNGLWGILFALMYLLYPAVGFINLFEFHPLAFVPVLLLFAFYFFRAKRFVPFLVFAVLAMMCREEVGLTVMMIGIYALIARRRWHWIVAPAAAGLIWFIICLHVIIPHYNKGQNIFGRLYGDMGSTPAEVMKTAITDPGKTIGVALKQDPAVPGRARIVNKPRYLQHVFAPTGYLALANPEALLVAAPQFALNLLVETDIHKSPPTIYFQYTATLIPVLFFSSVLGVARVLRIRVLTQFWFGPMLVVLLISGITWVRWSPQVAPAAKPMPPERAQNSDWPPRVMAQSRYQRPADAAEYREMLDLMRQGERAGAPVVATFRFLPGLSDRATLASFHYVYMGHEKVAAERKYVLPEDVRYALLDLGAEARWTQFADPRDADNFRRMLEDGDWGVEARREQLVLLEKNAASKPPGLFSRIEDDEPIQGSFTCEYGGFLKMLKAEPHVEMLDKGERQVVVGTWWEVLSPLSGRLTITYALFSRDGKLVEVTGEGGPVRLQVSADLGNYALLPRSFGTGDRFGVEHAVLIPAGVPDGQYVLGMLVAPYKYAQASTSQHVQGDSITVVFNAGTPSAWPITMPRTRALGGGLCFITPVIIGEGAAP